MHIKTYSKILTGPIIRLEQASKRHQQMAEEMKNEFFHANEKIINGSALLDQMDFDEWIINVNRNHHIETVSDDWAIATTFFAFRQSDDKMIGMIDVRHELTVPFLKQYGGHIGYAVRPTERRKGYAVQMLQLALQYCCSIGLDKVMLGCYANNEASRKTIEHCGGTKTQEKLYTDGNPMYIYHISL